MICNDHREDEDMTARGKVRIEDSPGGLGRIVDLDALAVLKIQADELEALRTRARHLAAVQGLDVEHRTLALAGRIVLGLAPEVRA